MVLSSGWSASDSELPPGDDEVAGEPERSPGVLTVDVWVGDITGVDEPVAAVGRYLNTPADGSMRNFDARFGGWIQTAIDRGIIGSLLGELSFVPLSRKVRGPRGPELLIIGGMGEYGRFNRDDLSYLASNIALAVRALGHERFACVMIGTGNQGMPPSRSVRAIVEGVLAAFDHFPAEPRGPRLHLTLCALTEATAKAARDEVERIATELAGKAGGDAVLLKKESTRRRRRGTQPAESTAPTEDKTPSPNRVTISRVSGPLEAPPGSASPVVTLEYSALTNSAVVPVREQEIQSFFLSRLPERLRTAGTVNEQQKFGELLSRYLVSDDLRPLIQGEQSLVLILDTETAAIPWEMACHHRLGVPRFFGTNLELSRQFRTAQTVAPGIPPKINDRLRILIIADPAGGDFALLGAREEAGAVLRTIANAHEEWGGRLKIDATVRVGPPGTSPYELRKVVEGLPPALLKKPPRPCDPLEVLALLLNDGFDVVHFAGHGCFDPQAGRLGWVFGDGCLISATEMFKVGRIPRLVFANACHSGRLAGPFESKSTQMVSMAEALFSQGIENYIGTGWEVADKAAVTFAENFYKAALGKDRDQQQLARAAASAREALLHQSLESPDNGSCTTWGAYQYYGQPRSRLIQIDDSAEA